jgi:hypothetical protein
MPIGAGGETTALECSFLPGSRGARDAGFGYNPAEQRTCELNQTKAQGGKTMPRIRDIISQIELIPGCRPLAPLRARQFLKALLGACALWLAFGSLDLARAAHGDFKTAAERWAWSQIKQGEIADFNKHCGTPRLDPKDEKDARWQDKCRMLPARFLVDLLTGPPWREQVPSKGVRIAGARIAGDLDLENAKLLRSIEIYDRRIEGAINLKRAHTESLILLAGSLVNGDFTADGLHNKGDLFLRDGTLLKSEVRLTGAEIHGDVDMSGASVEGALDADSLQVGGDLYLGSDGENKARFKEVILRGAKITGQINMTGATVDGELNADSLQVGGNLYMRSDGENKASFKEVNLDGAKITGWFIMTGASFDGELDANPAGGWRFDRAIRSKEQDQLQASGSERSEDHGTDGHDQRRCRWQTHR